MKHASRICLLLALLAASPRSCSGFEPGFYGWQNDREQCEKILETWSAVNHMLECKGDSDSIVDLYKNPKSSAWVRRSQPDGTPILFTRTQIEEFLKKDPSKNTLVITVKPNRSNQASLMAQQMNSLVSPLGYRRVLVLRAGPYCPGGIVVISDTSYLVPSRKEQ